MNFRKLFFSICSTRYGDSDMGIQVGDTGGLGLEGTLPEDLEDISPESITVKPRGH